MVISLAEIKALVDEVVPWAIDLRRELHKWTEIGNQEYKTIERIEAELDKMGIESEKILRTGIVACLGDMAAECIALRADIDGLPIEEKTDLPFRSVHEGYMHACGHDVHTSVLLGTAKLLSNIKRLINKQVKFIFQPAEETTGGAKRMIETGCLKQPDVSSIYGLHVKPEIEAGKIGIKYGRVHASSVTFHIVIKGVASHGAIPDCGVDALLVACQVVNSLQSIVSRSVSPLDSAVVTVGSINSGKAANIISDYAKIEGTLRSFSEKTKNLLKSKLESIAINTAKAFGAYAEVEFIEGYEALINHDENVDKVKNVAKLILGENNVIEIESPTMGVEDFSYYLNKVPGAFFFLGSGFPDRYNPPLHSANFNINEECIRTGIMLFTCLILQK